MERHRDRLRRGMAKRGVRNGFTLVELLVVMGVVAILIGFLLVGISNGRKYARMTACNHNIRQIGLAADSYVEDHRGFLFPCLPPKPVEHWINLLAADYMSGGGDVFLCPEVRPEDAFNPYGGEGRYDEVKKAGYIMNVIHASEWAGYSGTFLGKKYGWTRNDGTDAVKVSGAARASQAILTVDTEPPMRNNMVGKMIMRWSETDHGILDGANPNGETNSHERKVSRQHLGRFSALYGDMHVENQERSDPDEWVAIEEP